MGIYLHPLSSGYADRAGIHFRRYLFIQFVSWDEVETILWSTQKIVVLLRGPRRWQRRINFKLHAGPMDALTEAHGEYVREPEFIRWLSSTSVEQTRRFEIRHLERSRDSSWRNPSLYKGQWIALACVWTIALALAVFSAAKPR